jgi:DNA invertase Pin-like site-specific DNA recombinase
MSDTLRSPKLKGWHLDRVAIVYVRQSTPQQVADHKESTARQYALADRAVALGWTRDRVTIIDDDLGKSGQSIEGRLGFQRLLAEVALDNVGLILGLEMSRLARSCRDWHQLLELCARFRVLLADADGVFDPTDHSDRLVLGLHGMMNEAELHVLKQRMHQGKLNKARRGELFTTPPIGYVWSPERRWATDPDEQVRATVRLIFDQFDRQATMHGLLRYLVHHQVRVPVRPAGGPNKGQLEWHRPSRATLLNVLRHPCYAGAYRYGHRPVDPRQKQPGRPGTGKRVRRPDECLVLIRDHLPAYITWDRFEANQARLAANRNSAVTPGAARNGPSLLAGLVWCGRCGQRMVVRYDGRREGLVSYSCCRASADYAEPLCQRLSCGSALDALVAGQLLAAVAPAALEASLAAVADVEREHAGLTRQWNLKRERAAFEVGRAERQFQACEPENRLVARELERRWEEALKAKRRLDDEYERWQRSAPGPLSDAAVSAIRALSADLPAVWSAPSTTPADRQRVARLLLEQVVVTVEKSSERVGAELHWVGGTVRSHALTRPVGRYAHHSDYPRLVERVRTLCGERQSPAAIAERLNAEGFRPPKRASSFTPAMARRLTIRLGFGRRARHGGRAGLGPDEYRPMELARRLGVGRDAVRGWVRSGWVNARRDADAHHVIWADADELERLRVLCALPRTWENRARLAELKKPKQQPT